MMKESHAKGWSHQRGVDLLIFFQKNERQLENINHEKVVIHIHTEYSHNNMNTKERHEKVVGNLDTKYDEKVINTKEFHEKVVGHIQTKYNEKVKHYDKVVNKLNTKHSKKNMNTIEHNKKVVCKLKTKHSKKENKKNERHVKVIDQLHSHRFKQEIVTRTHTNNQVNKLMSQLTLTKYQLVKQKESFHSAKFSRRQVVQEAA